MENQPAGGRQHAAYEGQLLLAPRLPICVLSFCSRHYGSAWVKWLRLSTRRAVLSDEAIGVPPDGLKSARPGVLDANVSSATGARRNLVANLVVDDRMDARHAYSSRGLPGFIG
jgi:hypothetical protein